MSLSRDSRAERKLKAWRRAEFRLKQNLERIDFEEDVLLPEIEDLKAGRTVLSLPAGAVFDVLAINVDQNTIIRPVAKQSTNDPDPAPPDGATPSDTGA